MEVSETARNQFSVFLQRHCPKPIALEQAMERHGLLTLHDKRPGEYLCRRGDIASACWLILDGMVEVKCHDQNVAFRKAGDLVGEQALLQTLYNQQGRRTADMIACGPLKVACIDASFQHRLAGEDKEAWILTLASVVNRKLDEATNTRSSLQKSATDREILLSRFADRDALGIVKIAADDETSPVQNREVVVWFSDVANFSTWALDKKPDEVARILRHLTSIQVDLIRKYDGTVDKLVGDGVMAFWFIDSPERNLTNPRRAIDCAEEAIRLVRRAVASEGLSDLLDLRVGLHSGPAVFGDFGAKDRIAVTILGTTVNTAARYEQAKSPALGPLRISPELKALADRDNLIIDLEGPIEVIVKHDVTIPIYTAKMETAHVLER